MLCQAPTERVSATELRQVCVELEQRLSAGEACSAEAMFAAHPGVGGDADAALEVIYTEFVAREHLGQRPTPDEFYARFPTSRDGLEQLFQIHATVDPGSAAVPAGLEQECPPGEWRRVGNYELLGEVGRGGMGVVYKARQIGLNRLVALKMILTGAEAGPQERARFRAEAEAAARLQHSNIVQIHEVGEHDGRPFLCLEFVDGGNLEKLLTGEPWQSAEAAWLVETLARAMHYAHQQGVIHRDLKPANILLVSGANQPKITDFGLARRLPTGDTGTVVATGPTRSGAIVGTPAYMSPEQAAGDGGEIGPAADVHALGAILYELLTGRSPFQGVSVLETLEQVRTHEPLPPSRLTPALPRDLETICLKCLEKEPGRRYPSAAALADDLGRFQRGEPILARASPAWEKARKWARRRPAIAALLAAVVVLAIGGLTSVTILWQQTAAALMAMRQERDDKEAALASKLVALAERDWMANDLDSARRHLDECPPARRSQKWRYLYRVCHAELCLLGSRPTSPGPDSSGNVASMAWSPDGLCLAADYLAGAVKVWDLETRGELLTLKADAYRLNRLAFDPDGQLVTATWLPNLTGSFAKSQTNVEVKKWEVKKGREIRSDAMALLMSPGLGALSGNGRRFAAIQGNKLRVYDIQDKPKGTSILPADLLTPIRNMTLSSDGRMLAWWTGDMKNMVRVWDTTTWEMAGAGIAAPTVTALTFSPDGARLAVGRYDRDTNAGIASVWDYRNVREILTLHEPSAAVACIAFSPDSRRLATSADRSVLIWDLETGKERFTFRGHLAPVSALAFSADGTRLASGGNDGTVRIWDARPFEEQPD